VDATYIEKGADFSVTYLASRAIRDRIGSHAARDKPDENLPTKPGLQKLDGTVSAGTMPG
jgi:hypothetical protein